MSDRADADVAYRFEERLELLRTWGKRAAAADQVRDQRIGVAGEFNRVDIHVVVEVRPIVTRGISASGADVPFVGIPKDFDQAILEITLLLAGIFREVADRILKRTQCL